MIAAFVAFALVQASPADPHRILLTWSSDPATSATVTWRTESPTAGAEGQIALATADPSFGNKARSVAASSQKIQSVYYHTVKFTGLTPETLYAYRVGSKLGFSEWLQIRTASKSPKPFSFIYFGDAQNDIKSLWSRAMRQAYRQEARADFMVHAGDLINISSADNEWRDWFYAGAWIHSMVPSVAVPGNHEYGGGKLSEWWIPQFEYPRNGIALLPDTNYFFDYQGARIVALDSNREIEAQTKWLEGVLKSNPNKWAFVAFHHPVYSTAEGRDNPKIRAAWKPILEKYNVAIVLQGHDHTYGRLNAPTGVTARNEKTGTVYVVSVSGPKMYEMNEAAKKSMKKVGAHKQLYQVVSVNGDKVEYRAYLVTGELYDGFDLRKNADGTNTIIDR